MKGRYNKKKLTGFPTLIIFCISILLFLLGYKIIMDNLQSDIEHSEWKIDYYIQETERIKDKIVNKKSKEIFDKLKAERMELEKKLQEEKDSKVYSTLVTNTKVPYLSFYLDRPYFIYEVKFKQSFIDKYEYENSDTFCFAANVQSNGIGGYRNTYRNHNGGVSNSSKDLCPGGDIICRLDGCIPAIAFMGSGVAYSFEGYAVNNYFANKDSYGYKNLIIKEGDFKFYMSSVKELPRTEVFEVKLMK